MLRALAKQAEAERFSNKIVETLMYYHS